MDYPQKERVRYLIEAFLHGESLANSGAYCCWDFEVVCRCYAFTVVYVVPCGLAVPIERALLVM